MKTLTAIFCFVVLFHFDSVSQSCGLCKRTPSIAQYDLDVQVPPLSDTGELMFQWKQLFWISHHAQAFLFHQNKGCVKMTQPASSIDSTGNETLIIGETYTNLPGVSSTTSGYGDYFITGFVKKTTGQSCSVTLELRTGCNRKLVVSAETEFQLSSSSDYIKGIAQQIAARLTPLIDHINRFEKEERGKDPTVAFASLGMDEIRIVPKKRHLTPNESTELELIVLDCDGLPLAGREIHFTEGSVEGMSISGTIGGIVIPSKVMTDQTGKAKATFKMGKGPNAIINAHLIHKTPAGCNYAKLGSIVMGPASVKIELTYTQYESQTIKRATLPSISIEGGDQREQTWMAHKSVIYHTPSPGSLKNRFLVSAVEDNSTPPGKTMYMMENGVYEWKKFVRPATIQVIAGNIKMIGATEKDTFEIAVAFYNKSRPSEFVFFLGDKQNPPYFGWTANYPIVFPPGNTDAVAGGSVYFAKGDEGVQWQVKKITDPNSPYMTEYLLSFKSDAAEELKKGEKAMKELFGFNVDGLTKMIDPTNPQSGMVTAAGSKILNVRILSPYPDKEIEISTKIK